MATFDGNDSGSALAAHNSAYQTGTSLGDLTTPLGATPIGPAGPVLSLLSPAPGALAATLIEARYTPITFRLADTDGIKDVVITVWFDGHPEPIVAYDDTGWRGRFAGPSSASATPGGPTPPTQIDFEVLPIGGWRQNIAAMKINALDIYGRKEGVDV